MAPSELVDRTDQSTVPECMWWALLTCASCEPLQLQRLKITQRKHTLMTPTQKQPEYKPFIGQVFMLD